ncbi:MAG: hypothetical protein H6707_04090 [Deltaproteobacteria bacterium]|nr:hypothetical protein [Deltaproteobacteria bacterium]
MPSTALAIVGRNRQYWTARSVDDPLARRRAAKRMVLGLQQGANARLLNLDTRLRVILHEVGHSLGFQHEHQRADRGKGYCARGRVIAALEN